MLSEKKNILQTLRGENITDGGFDNHISYYCYLRACVSMQVHVKPIKNTNENKILELWHLYM